MDKLKIALLFLVFITGFNINAQQKLQKISKSVNVDKDVTLNLDTSHTNIEIESWNKNEIQVEAYIESKKLNKKELQKILDHWNVNIEGSGSNVKISTKGSDVYALYGDDFDFNFDFDFNGEIHDAMKDLKIVMSNLNIPNIDLDFSKIKIPNLPNLPEMPEFPELPELPEGIHSIHFDYDAYEKEGEKYLKKWSKEYEEKYGKEYGNKMEAWAKKFSKSDFKKWSKEVEKWGEEYGHKFEGEWANDIEIWAEKFAHEFENSDWIKNIEKWGEEFGESFGKDMEKWGEKFGKDMEKWGEKFGKDIEKWAEKFDDEDGDFQKRIKVIEKKAKELELEGENRSKVIKTIKIKMPKDTKLKVNVRHGELKFASVVHNLNADLAHSKLLAIRIDGNQTSINAAYSTVNVDDWNQGELKLKYGEYTKLKRVNWLRLNSNSSDITIGELIGNAIISGSFGDLEINSISNSFTNLNLVLDNTDAVLKLPKTAYNLQCQGNRSRFSHPDQSPGDSASSFSRTSFNSSKNIVINAKYSNVVMQ